MRHEPESKKQKLIQEESGVRIYSGDTVSTSSEHKTEHLPEAICEFNVLEASSVRAGTQYKYSDFLGKDDDKYAKPWTDNQTTLTQTNILCMDEKGVQVMTETGTMSAKGSIVTDCDSLLYSGVTKEVFFTLVELMKIENTFSFQLDVTDQLLLVLMKLKLNLQFNDLAGRFGIAKGLTSRMYNSWMPVLAEKLQGLVVWLPRETIRACCPESFRENYPRTTMIVYRAETFIQSPTNLKTRSETFSNYKSHNTAKYLVDISPHGQIMFISKAFGGRASDKFIVENSVFFYYLLPGDEVMADRGFTIEDFLFPRRVKLDIRAFIKCKPQLSNEDVTTTRRIAHVRIHVERAIRRFKVFNILRGTVPVSSLKNFNDISIVCAALVNLQSDLIRDVHIDAD